MKEAADRWQSEQGMVDDITIIVSYLNVGGARQPATVDESASSGVVPAAIPVHSN
jgi:hypothetical protein